MTPAQRQDLEQTVAGMSWHVAEHRAGGPRADLADYVTGRAIETGGFFKPACPGNSWDSQRFEITLQGVFAQGEDLHDAARNWLRAARATLRPAPSKGRAVA